MILTHVERVLRDCCGPGCHDYRPEGGGMERCGDCGRLQRTDGTTCLFCESDGRREAVVSHRRSGREVAGVLCGPCDRELSFRGEVAGWQVSRVQLAG